MYAALEDLDLMDEPLLNEEIEGMEPYPQGAAGGGLEIACVAGGENVDLIRPELDGVRYRCIVGDPTVDEILLTPSDGREDCRDRRAREHGVNCVTSR